MPDTRVRAATRSERLWDWLQTLAEQPMARVASTLTNLLDEGFRGQTREDPNWKLGIVPVEALPGLPPLATAKPDVIRHVLRSGGREVEGGLALPVSRFQRPEMVGQPALREGVFYRARPPQTTARWYRNNPMGFGGTQRIVGEVGFRNPLLLPAGEGGDLARKALNRLGRPKLTTAVDEVIGRDPRRLDDLAETLGVRPTFDLDQLRGLIAERPDMRRYARLHEGSAMREWLAGRLAAREGYDVLGSTWGNRIGELMDLREARYPGQLPFEYWLHETEQLPQQIQRVLQFGGR